MNVNAGDKAERNDAETSKSLALARATAARQALFECMAEMALRSKPALNDSERGKLDRILVDLVRYVERSVRAKVAQRLAHAENPPREILRALAFDEIAVAKPILTACGALEESALADIAREGSKAHKLVLAGRDNVPETVSDALVESGDIEIVETLINNDSAEIAPKTLDRIAQMSEANEALQMAVLNRSELSPVTAHRMFWFVSGQLRKHIVDHYTVDIDELDRVLDQAVADGVVEAVQDVGLERVLRAMSQAPPKPVAALIEELKYHSIDGFTVQLSRQLGIDSRTAERIVMDEGGEAVALACRAMEADRGQFTSIFLLIDFKRYGRARPAAHLGHVTALYDRVTRDSALASMALFQHLGLHGHARRRG